jgi:predicted MPP superfamily phosphohydrolase
MKNGFRLLALSFVGFGFAGRNNLIVERHALAFQNLPKAFDKLRIVQISDLHASFWVGRGYLDKVVDWVNRLPKDLLVITGDIITGSVNDFWKRWLPVGGGDYIAMVIQALQRLDDGPKFAVLGNHDQWDGRKTETHLVHELERIGIMVLRNRSHVMTRGQENLYIAGTDDVWFSYDADRALRDIPPEGFTIVLSHSPDVREDLGPPAKIELALCGHTHGGQIAVPYLTPHLMPIKNPARYLSGLVKETYGYTYVNRGIGTLVFPLRLGAPPEITAIKLVRA